jgi:hypothetical protein
VEFRCWVAAYPPFGQVGDHGMVIDDDGGAAVGRERDGNRASSPPGLSGYVYIAFRDGTGALPSWRLGGRWPRGARIWRITSKVLRFHLMDAVLVSLAVFIR